jgi:phospholipid/cholesterol/gamma-HCH transport system substrate-binding protein
MERDRRASLAVGIFALAALAAGAVAVVSLTAEQGLLRPHYRLVCYFENVQGLTEGAPVRLAGKDVGTVQAVTFGPLGGKQPPVKVVLSIDTGVRERIRSDSLATIETVGLLGDKYVEVSMGTPAAEVLGDGARIPAVTPLDLSDVLAQGTQALDNVAKLASNVNGVVDEFRNAKGPVKVADAARTFADVAREVKEGHGLLHSLIYDTYQGEGVESITRSLATLQDVLDQIAHGPGLAHALIYQPVGKSDGVEAAMEAARHLDDVLARIDRGEGTLGLLVTDPTLYEDLKTLVGGAQRSWLVRALIALSGGGDHGQGH